METARIPLKKASKHMQEISSISDLQYLVQAGETNWQQYGDVNVTLWDGLLLFNYSARAQYARRWNFFERVSRGLILDAVTAEVVARPFDKFFNVGEGAAPQGRIVDVTVKMDGSLGILYRHRGQLCIATRGSFQSDQAVWASSFLNRKLHHLYGSSRHLRLPDDVTLLFEIIYPANRVVVDYEGYEGLVLIGARNRHNGTDYAFNELRDIAFTYELPLVNHEPGMRRQNSLQFVLDTAQQLSANDEGYVVRYEDGTRLKVKGEAYRLAHRLLTGVSFNRVLEAVRDGKYYQLIEGVPDEFLGQIKSWKAEINREVFALKTAVEVFLRGAPAVTQKEFAAWVQTAFAKDRAMQSYLFAAKAGKDITPLIYRKAFEHRPNREKPQMDAEG